MIINNINFQVESNIENERKNVTVIPFPESFERFKNASDILGFESLNLLWSKHYFGINHRNQMFRVLYNTFEDTFSIEDKTIDHYLTLQVLYCDMIIRLGTILEDFAGICVACKEHTVNGKDIAEVFLAYSDPIGFYNSIASRRGRLIKQIFRLPESKGNLNKIFNNLSNNEIEVLWKGVEASTQLIIDTMEHISTSIVRREANSMSYYDMYNKLKHGFAPVYPFAMPVPFPIMNAPTDMSDKELILKYMMENITVMHDKLPGQRSTEEQEKYETLRLATPAFTYEEVHLETASNILNVVNDIDKLYKYLVKRYITYAEGSKKISLLMAEGLLSDEEQEIILNIIENEERYI